MSDRLTFHTADVSLAVKFDGEAIPAEKLPPCLIFSTRIWSAEQKRNAGNR